jgi:hypothetical protein
MGIDSRDWLKEGMDVLEALNLTAAPVFQNLKRIEEELKAADQLADALFHVDLTASAKQSLHHYRKTGIWNSTGGVATWAPKTRQSHGMTGIC